jgi:phage tail sheath gpL-like
MNRHHTSLRGVIRVTDDLGRTLFCGHNLATNFTTQAIAQAYMGESYPDIAVAAMAFGSGDAAVAVEDTALASELMRLSVSKSRVGSRVVFSATLANSAAIGPVRCLGLFGPAGGSGSVAAGSLTIGGTPAGGNSVLVRFDGRAASPYFTQAGQSAAAVAAGLKALLEADDAVAPYYAIALSGSTLNFTARGAGTVYNKSLTAVTVGGVTATAMGITGGATPGGQLLHAANCSFVKRTGRQVTVTWGVEVK